MNSEADRGKIGTFRMFRSGIIAYAIRFMHSSSRCSVAHRATITASLAMLCFASSAGAQILNYYSRSNPAAPVLNYGIAQGSIFNIQGLGLAQNLALPLSQGVPLQTTLAGVTISITVAGVTTQAIPYFVDWGQITAVLPSKTPVGSGTVTIVSGGVPGLPRPITVVPSAFALATVAVTGAYGTVMAQDESEGTEPEAGGARRILRAGGNCGPSVQLPLAPAPSRNPCLLSQSNAANPGEELTFWGTGLGPVSGDETQYQAPTDLTNVPIEVDIGGVSATVLYHGRSIYPGVDRIDVIVPAAVSGCNVSVAVTAGGVPSNVATIPVASAGRICSDPGLIPVTAGEYQTLLSQSNVNVGLISLSKLTIGVPPAKTATSDSAFAEFGGFTAQQFAPANFLQQASVGSCLMTDNYRLVTDFYLGTAPPFVRPAASGLDAGQQIDISGPGGSLALPQIPGMADGSYSQPEDVSSAIIPSTGGTLTLDNGSGGVGVGAFAITSTDSLTTPLVWTNSAAITSVDRTKGQLVTWTGGTPGTYVNIFGYSSFSELGETQIRVIVTIYFTCTAAVSAGQFTVPAAVLGNLPSSGVPGGGNGYLYVVNQTNQRFSAPGLDLGLISYGVGSGISVPFN
jgi:uncharacterized protein (TIGR03437 family)